MSIIENAERYMKRYDYLMDKRERKHKQGKRLTPQEDEELQKLRPNVFTPILVMFELLHDTVKTNQILRKSKQVQSGGAGGQWNINDEKEWEPSATAAATAAATATAAAATVAGTAITKPPPQQMPEASAPPLEDDDEDEDEDPDAAAKEAGRLSELEDSLLPLLTKIIVYIEQNKKKEKKKDDDADEEEKYPDIGTTAKNSAILVIRRIKKWWNDLIQGGSSDLSSKINLRKAIPQLSDNSTDMNALNEMADKVITAVDDPLKKISKILSNDVRDIASSSVEGIMNALSLIPGIGTTLQLWRLLQNVIVIMSKSVTTMAGAKTQGVALKTNIMGLKDQLAGDAMNMAQGAAAGAVTSVAGGGLGDMAKMAGAGGLGDMAKMAGAGGLGDMAKMAGAGGGLGDMAKMAGAGGALGAATSMMPPGAGAVAGLAGKFLKGGSTNHLRSIKKYKREYKQSIREIRKTRKKMMKYIRNII